MDGWAIDRYADGTYVPCMAPLQGRAMICLICTWLVRHEPGWDWTTWHGWEEPEKARGRGGRGERDVRRGGVGDLLAVEGGGSKMDLD
jgi:hypothetical protein